MQCYIVLYVKKPIQCCRLGLLNFTPLKLISFVLYVKIVSIAHIIVLMNDGMTSE
jgi:hypothetical protein